MRSHEGDGDAGACEAELMKTISDMLLERDRERQREAARRQTSRMVGLALFAVMLGAASAIVLVLFVAAIRTAEIAPAVGGLAP